VENESNDETVNAIKTSFPDTLLIQSLDNIGFGKANNKAIAEARGELLFFLNSDTILRLAPFFQQYYVNYRQKNFDFSQEKTVEMVMGAAMIVPKIIIDEVGGFDPRFFMYFEEVDLCCRIKEAGCLVKYTPSAVVRHVGGASSSQACSRMYLIYWQSMVSYFRKHKGRLKTVLFSLLFKPLFLLQTLFLAMADASKAITSIAFGNNVERVDKYRKRCRTKINFLMHDLFSFVLS